MRKVWYRGAWVSMVAVIAVLIGTGAVTDPNPSPTPTATATGTPTPTSLNCTPDAEDTMTNVVSHLCGFADTTNTGPSDEDALVQVGGVGGITSPTTDTGSGWTFSGGVLNVSTDGAVVKNVDVQGTIGVSSSDVTIQNFKVNGGGLDTYGIRLQGADNIVIEHGEIRGKEQFSTNRLDTGIRDMLSGGDPSNDLTIRNVNISWASSCLNNITDSGLIEYVYCHDMGRAGADHVNGIQMEDGPHDLLTLRNSTFLNQEEQADAVMLANDNGGTHVNRLVDHNLLAGGSFCFYGRGGPGGTSQDVTFTNNHFSRLFYSTCGSINVEAYWSLGIGNSNVWSGNVWDDTGATVDPNL